MKPGTTHTPETKLKMSEHKRGENHPGAQLTWTQVHQIRADYAAGEVSYADLSKQYSTSRGCVVAVVRGLTWPDSCYEYKPRARRYNPTKTKAYGNSKITWAEVGDIRQKLTSGETVKALASEFKTRTAAIYGIKSNRTWKHD
jgi:hypothetical protein